MQKGNYKMLLVDDDQFLLNMYSLKFGKNGYDVTAISNPQEALTKLREGLSPDVIVLDIIMPGIDGLQVLQTIRDEKLASNAAVVMLTNQGDGIERAKKLGVAGYIVKATTIPSEVVKEVSDIMAHQQSK
ncbi:MAG TPA: response regulator [Candidatus Paceibacterota bacterium]|jgi:CheY-like chemotaxis protein|nr:response regulator [Candidatus Paceibacterota bacterium]